jgi:hypothetical protein
MHAESSSPGAEEIAALIASLDSGSGIPAALVTLTTEQTGQQFLTAILAAFPRYETNYDALLTLLQLLRRLATDCPSSVISNDLSLPALLDCVRSPNPDIRKAAVGILADLAAVDPSALTARGAEWLSLVNESDDATLPGFLRLITALSSASADFREFARDHLFDRLVVLVRNGASFVVPAMRALIVGDLANQARFFTSDCIGSICSHLASDDPEATGFLVDVFTDDAAPLFRPLLVGSPLLDLVIRKAAASPTPFLGVLSVWIRGDDSLCDYVIPRILSGFDVTVFKPLLLECVKKLPNFIVTSANRRLLVDLAVSCIVSDRSSVSVFLESSFFESVIEWFISEGSEPVTQFLLCACHNCKEASLAFLGAQSNPFRLLVRWVSLESFGPLLHGQLCLLLRTLLPFCDAVPTSISVESLDDTVRGLSCFLRYSEGLAWELALIPEALAAVPREVVTEKVSGVYILVGLYGSGKTATAKRLSSEFDVISFD